MFNIFPASNSGNTLRIALHEIWMQKSKVMGPDFVFMGFPQKKIGTEILQSTEKL